jgi:hypothetical protein
LSREPIDTEAEECARAAPSFSLESVAIMGSRDKPGNDELKE